MTFDKNTICKIQDLYLHDAEITKVSCDYDMHRIEILIKFPERSNECKEAIIICEEVQYIDFSFYAPWGPGIYISEINVNDGTAIINRLVDYKTNNEIFCLSVLINSGDRINILTSKVVFLEMQK